MNNLPNDSLPYQSGWVCPICRMVMAPFAPSCFNCKPKKENLQFDLKYYTLCQSTEFKGYP